MAKYHELQQTYAEEIERIKSLQKSETELSQKLDEAYKMAVKFDEYPGEAEEIEEQLSQVVMGLHVDMAHLTQEVEIEYWDVPFSKPRQQGMQRFFEIAGI